MTPVLACARMCRVQGAKLPAQGCSSIGRPRVSKTAGCRFKSCHPCQHHRRQTVSPQERPPPRGERGAVSDERRDRDEQLDADAPGVDDAAELEAAEAEVA